MNGTADTDTAYLLSGMFDARQGKSQREELVRRLVHHYEEFDERVSNNYLGV